MKEGGDLTYSLIHMYYLKLHFSSISYFKFNFSASLDLAFQLDLWVILIVFGLIYILLISVQT